MEDFTTTKIPVSKILNDEIAGLRNQLKQKDEYIKSLEDHANYTRKIMHSLSNEGNFNCETCG